MAVQPFAPSQPKEKKDFWDQLNSVLGVVGTTAGLANGVSGVADKISQSSQYLGDVPATTADKLAFGPSEDNPWIRRFRGGR